MIDTAKDMWWQSFYQDTPFIAYLDQAHREDLEHILQFLHGLISLDKNTHLFDQCCGVGSVSLPLAAQSVQVTGVDICPQFIDEAIRRAKALPASTRASYHLADATEFLPDTACDIAINLYTSFGYADDSINQAMLNQARASLKAGAPFVLDYPNMYSVLGVFRKHIVKHLETVNGPITVTRASTIDHLNGRLLQQWTFIQPDGTRTARDSSLAIYLPHQVKEMLLKAGFETVALYGGFDGQALSSDSVRCLAVAR